MAPSKKHISCTISSSPSYNGEAASSSDTEEERLDMTIAGPRDVHVGPRLTGVTLIDLNICTIYAYVSGNM